MHKIALKPLLFALSSTLTLIAGIPDLDQLSLDQKIGQLFVVATVSDEERNTDFMKMQPYHLKQTDALTMIRDHHVGGIIFLGASTPNKQVAATNMFQKKSRIPLLIAQDAEWGLSMRHQEDVITYPRAMTLGALSDEDETLIYHVGHEIGRHCKAIGVHFNFAPVADVNNEPENPIINVRSFGEDPKLVAKKAALFARGMQDAGVLACAKHFPGHGNTKTDSHVVLPMVPHTRAALERIELVPFAHLIRQGVDAIMTAHLAVPHLTENATMPTTLSHNVITKLLREEFGFEGLIVTDGLGMKGVTEQLEAGEPELKALLAGNDILLCPVDVPRAIERIKQALQDGILSEADIDKHVERILRAKKKANIAHSTTFQKEVLQSDAARALKEELYRAAITLARNHGNTLPLQKRDRAIPVITNDENTNPPFVQKLREYIEITHHHLEPTASQKECDQLEEQLKGHQQIITALHIPGRSGMLEMQHAQPGKEGSSPYTSLINKLGAKALLVLFGNPYNLKHFPDSAAAIVAYENEPESQTAAAETFVGIHNPRGRLPVTASEEYPQGMRKLSYCSSNKLTKVCFLLH